MTRMYNYTNELIKNYLRSVINSYFRNHNKRNKNHFNQDAKPLIRNTYNDKFLIILCTFSYGLPIYQNL